MDYIINVLEGLLDLPVWAYVGITLVLTHITIAAVTIYLHRHQSHNSLTLHPVVSHFFRFWLWLTTGMVTKQWVAIHRKHHAKCETAEDPHSPQVEGIGKVFWQGSELYRAASKRQDIMDKYGHGTPDDWMERRVYSRFPFLGISLMLVLDVLLFGAIGITIFAVQMLWIPIWAAGVINGIGHFWGYRNFETEDASRNIVPWGILIGGEELHNNHHAYAASARLSNKWWEFDIGWMYITLMRWLRLAKVLKVAPKIRTVTGKQVVDMDTVRAIIRNRFYIIKLYGRKVIKPVLREERQGANEYFRRLYRRISKLMIREDIKLDSTESEMMHEALQQSKTLDTVYRLKQQLKALWVHSSQQQSNRLQRLQAWCSEAEQTGITALQEFAAYLRSHTLANPAV
jgi:stearoyl-CoA desaturase (delta-9 desaturase)